MTEQQNEPEKKVISKQWKTFIIISLIIYLAAMVGVQLTQETFDFSPFIILVAVITSMIVGLKKKNMKW